MAFGLTSAAPAERVAETAAIQPRVDAPGDPVTATEISAPGYDDAREWTVSYRSTSATGDPIVVKDVC